MGTVHKEPPLIELKIDVNTAICIIANIQLATRHPKNTGPSRRISESFARELQKIVERNRPELAAVIEMGWNPDFDVD